MRFPSSPNHLIQPIKEYKNQNIDISNFEAEMNDFKDKFGRNYQLASDKFRKAIEEIDKTIDHLQKTKDVHQYKQRSFLSAVLLCKPRLSASSNVANSKIAFWDVFTNSFAVVSLFFNRLVDLLSFEIMG